MLIASHLGINNRSTIDIDFLIKGIDTDIDSLNKILKQITKNENRKDIWFEISKNIEPIRQHDKYGGNRFHVTGHLSNIKVGFGIDITTGDPMHPTPSTKTYTTILGETCNLKMYPLESVLAEKMQTILYRESFNTRNKDYYDIHSIYLKEYQNLNKDNLKDAFKLTFSYRKTDMDKQKSLDTIYYISRNQTFLEGWDRYIKNNPYTNNLSFQEASKSCKQIIEDLFD